MRRAELAEQLERLGSYPTPLPDPRRVEEWERELYREFVVQPIAPAAQRAALQARRRRRQVLAASLAVAAAVSVIAFLVQRDSAPGVALDAASGASVLLPDGSTRPLQAGDQIPANGVVRTGPNGSVTINGTTVGAGQALIYDDDRVILLPAPSTSRPSEQPTTTEAASTAAPSSSAAGPQSSTATGGSQAPSSQPVAPPPKPADLPTVPPATAPPATPAAPPPSPVAGTPTAMVAQLQLTVTRANEGVRLSWTTTDSPAFERYVVVRGPAASAELTVIAELPDRQITSFTDPAAPVSIDLVYRVLALDAAGRPIAMSGTAMLEIGVASTDSTTTTAASTTAPPATDPGTTTPATDPATTAPVTDPPTTDEPPASDPGTAAPPVSDPPATDVTEVTEPAPPGTNGS
jgi:hypothetical protein